LVGQIDKGLDMNVEQVLASIDEGGYRPRFLELIAQDAESMIHYIRETWGVSLRVAFQVVKSLSAGGES